MDRCVYVFMHIHITYMHAIIYVYMYVDKYTYYKYICSYGLMHVCTHECVYVYILYECIHVGLYIGRHT